MQFRSRNEADTMVKRLHSKPLSKIRPCIQYRHRQHSINTYSVTPALRSCAVNKSRNRNVVLHASSVVTEAAEQQEAISESDDEDEEFPSDSDMSAAELESLRLLEWDKLCKQVACFCSTTMAATELQTEGLPLGTTQEHSTQLLQQTAEASAAAISFEGAVDVRPAVQYTTEGRILTTVQLAAIARTLEAAAATHAALQGASTDGQRFSALSMLAGDRLVMGLQHLPPAIRHCIQENGSGVLDRASPILGEVRVELRQTDGQRRSLADEWARLLHNNGAAERPQVVVRRDRLCIPVRAGRQSELPKGSVVLGSSNSGNTLYMEPAPLVKLNNDVTRLKQKEKQEELAVLMALSQQVADCGEQLLDCIDAITALDTGAARAKHAAWLGGVEPRWATSQSASDQIAQSQTTSTSGSSEHDTWGPVHIPGALHPLLAEPHRGPLPEPPCLDGLTFDDGYLGPIGGPVGGPAGGPARGKLAANENEEVQGTAKKRKLVPVDLTVPAGTKVVAVTGPNTGGKTASLKALALCCLMAKAGLWPAVDRESNPVGLAVVTWFDKVLADVGDGQNLQQSLSTFSGHIRRIRNILDCCSPQSLVLLDELGGGTDPTEGAALASAVLAALSQRAGLTYATTHHGPLKDMAATEPGFVNASVEFDVASLAPTYRLLWGKAGESNALLVAEGLNFDRAVVQEARQLLQQGLLARSSQTQASMLLSAVNEQLVEAKTQADAAAASRKEAQQLLKQVQHEYEIWQAGQKDGQSQRAQVDLQIKETKRKLDAVVQNVEQGLLTFEEGVAQVEALEAQLLALDSAQSTSATADSTSQDVATASSTTSSNNKGSNRATGARKGPWVPRAGERVVVCSMGKALAEVVVPPDTDRPSARVSVRLKSRMVVEVKASDLLPDAAAASNGTSQAGKRAAQAKKQKSTLRGMQSLRALQPDGATQDTTTPLLLQTAYNTVDVRGQRASEATAAVDEALGCAESGEAVFVIHGLGTGKLREAVREHLKHNKMVKKWEEEEKSNGGCTIVHRA